MIPKFRAYDSGSLTRMYQPDEMMVGDGNIWIIDEDSCDNEWIVNNDLHLMQSTGLYDKNGKEIFEGDILKFNDEWEDYCQEGYVDGFSEGINYVLIGSEMTYFIFEKTKYPDSSLFYYVNEEYLTFQEVMEDDELEFEVVGNIYENPELLEVE